VEDTHSIGSTLTVLMDLLDAHRESYYFAGNETLRLSTNLKKETGTG